MTETAIPIRRLRRQFFSTRWEPWVITAGLYAFTAVYYTRVTGLQVLSYLLLFWVAAYWSLSIRAGERPMGLKDFKLTRQRWLLNTLVAIGIAIFGWFFFRYYVLFTRGEWIPLGYGGSVPAIFAILAVSVAEELFFRGYLQNRLADRYGLVARVLIAVVAIALYKNVVHMWEGMPLVLHAELFLIGVLHNVVVSLFMEKSGSLVGPLVLHVVWDLMVYAPLPGIPHWVF